MPSRKNVKNTHIESRLLRQLHGALMDIVSVMNRPQRDEQMVREAGIALDRALFPLLVGIERVGDPHRRPARRVHHAAGRRAFRAMAAAGRQ